MNLMKKAVSALGGIFLAALLVVALAPKAVRSSVVAALVQVANPRSSPVPVDTVRQSASNFLALYTSTPSFPATWTQIFPDGTVGTVAYTIPEGEQFVVTDVLVVAACNTLFFGGTCPSAGTHFSVVFPAAGGFRRVADPWRRDCSYSPEENSGHPRAYRLSSTYFV